jgi:hypothetical protein
MSDDSWYVLVGGQQYGPYPLAAMEQFVGQGRLTPQSMLRRGETGDWAAAGQMLDFSHAPAVAGGYAPGYAPPSRSSRNTWIILAVVGGAGLLLLVLCLGLPLLWLTVRAPVREIHVEQSRPETQQGDAEANKATMDFEIKGMNESKIEWNGKDAKAPSPMEKPAVKPDGPKTPVEAQPGSRSP